MPSGASGGARAQPLRHLYVRGRTRVRGQQRGQPLRPFQPPGEHLLPAPAPSASLTPPRHSCHFDPFNLQVTTTTPPLLSLPPAPPTPRYSLALPHAAPSHNLMCICLSSPRRRTTARRSPRARRTRATTGTKCSRCALGPHVTPAVAPFHFQAPCKPLSRPFPGPSPAPLPPLWPPRHPSHPIVSVDVCVFVCVSVPRARVCSTSSTGRSTRASGTKACAKASASCA